MKYLVYLLGVCFFSTLISMYWSSSQKVGAVELPQEPVVNIEYYFNGKKTMVASIEFADQLIPLLSTALYIDDESWTGVFREVFIIHYAGESYQFIIVRGGPHADFYCEFGHFRSLSLYSFLNEQDEMRIGKKRLDNAQTLNIHN